ncbi:THO2 plays a role in transcriptional elongation [Vermiconidia calcicola]|uniref:THO2 plays a role in transcriptional elongation n=1 Tax=Vermiconidia calcicola TaxID=1690605 RepID=A0ACC3NBX5_9PEZI|nr:THO2 plays a role in transcriptional elongation [Vermiconidia calcicola]
MAPGGNKRKRPDRQFSQEDGSGRPSPHRPENMSMAQQSQQRGGSRGGRGGRRQSRQGALSPTRGVNATPVAPRNGPSPTPAAAIRETPTVDNSRPATPSQNTSAPSQPPADDRPKPSPAPYWYEVVTDERVGSWQDGGRQSIQNAAKEADDVTVSTILQELVRSALDRRLNAAEAGAVVQQMIADHQDNESVEVQILFLNTLSLLDEADTRSSQLLTLVAATDIDPEVIRQELDIPLLQALSLVRSSFTQMRTRKTTNLLYRQANFNLLREETEGYAKLITEYFNTANEAVHNHDVSAENAFERIKALVGSFDLDVGRVLDITLDISANLLVRAYGFFVKFYRCSSWWPDSGVLDNVKWEDQGFSSFPKWALPESERAKLDAEEESTRKEEEKRDRIALKELRDASFWTRVQDAGMDAFFDLGARKIVDFENVLPLLETEVQPEYDARQKEINADRRKRINENRRFMKETGNLPPPGDSDAAQLLGFKLRFYASDARDAQDVLPENLIYLAALLIKIGFISLRDLYPHLHPADDKMPEEKTRLEKEKLEKEAKERPGGGLNKLAMAGALTDDTAPAIRNLRAGKEGSSGSTPKPSQKDDEPREELPPPANQKIMLLKALLLIGALPEALYLLGRFPWLTEVDTSLPPYLHRLANKMLTKVADSLRPLSDREDTQASKDELKDTSVKADGSLNFKTRDAKKVTRWLGLDQVDKNDGQMYRHYYPDWDDNIPICQNVEDVISLCNTFLDLLGVKVGQDAALFNNLLRIAKHSLTEDGSEQNRARWLDLMRRLLVPALSLSKHNSGLTEAVYELLKFYPTTVRYNIYAEWFTGRTSRLPDMRVAFEHNRAEVRDVLRRVTNESGKKQGRALSKVSLSSPGVVMLSMISQLESYSNMIPSLVECTRYFSLLAYDILTWCLINSLSGQGRNRMQADGMLTSPWLQALSQFAASLFYRYNVINPSPVLQYLASELRAGNSTDLEVFEQVLAEMAGIRSDMEFNDAQVLAMAGGTLLQAQIVQQLADTRYERKVEAKRLIKALASPGLIGQTLISVAQMRQMYPYHESSKFMPLKVLGNNLDKIGNVFAQYLEVLKTNLKPAEFEAAVPDVVSLVRDFGLEPGIAFTICRTAIAHRVAEADAVAKKLEADEKKRRLSQEQSLPNGDVEMQDGESKRLTNGEADEQGETKDSTIGMDAEAVDEMKSALTPQPSATAAADDAKPWHPVLEPIIDGLSNLSTRLADRVSIPFLVTFWTLSLQDVFVPADSYTHESTKLDAQSRQISADRSDMSRPAIQERERTNKAVKELIGNLSKELKGRIAIYQKTRPRLSRKEKDHWFSRSTDKEDIQARHLALLQECFLPRAMLSSLDAQYSFLMLKTLHDISAPGFGTVHLLSQLMKKQELAAIMFQCTAMEAQNFARFLCETLKMLQAWHADQALYDKEALGVGAKHKLLGFARKLDAKGEPVEFLEYEEYRRLLFNWHSYLTGALQMCFESEEYMHIRNGIIVLKAVVQVFPSLNFQGNNMVKHVTTISQEDSRQDLKLAAMSLLGPLRNREKDWVKVQAFRLGEAGKEAGRPTSRAPSARAETPQPSDGTPELKATAPEFKPTAAVATNGVDRKASIAGKEDGEIEDEKQAAAVEIVDQVMKYAPDAKEVKNASERKTESGSEVKGATESKPAPPQSAKEDARPALKPPTPAPVPAKPPPPAADLDRPGSSRPNSTQPAAISRSAHALPTRPESSHPPSHPPSKPLPALPSDRKSGRHPARAEERFGRLDRPNEVRPASRGHSPDGRGRARTPERDPYYASQAPRGPPRDDRGQPRGFSIDSRHSREEAWSTSHHDHPPQPPVHSRLSYDSRDRPSNAMGPPPNQNARPERSSYNTHNPLSDPAQHSSRATPNPAQESQQNNSGHNENPARLALINKGDLARDGPTPSKDVRRERDTKDDRAPTDARPNGNGTAPPEPPRDAQPSMGPPSDIAPTGPRRGRHSRDLNAQGGSESSYGRLNGPQDVPSGPRAPNGPSGRSTRNNAAPSGPPNSRSNEPPPPSPSGPRPTSDFPTAPRGPNSRPAPDRQASGSQFERQPSSNSVPTTPAADEGPQVHPSRMSHIAMQPPPIQTNLPASGPRNEPTSVPPVGPRGSNRPPVGTPTGPSPGIGGAPSGPASAAERQRRGDRQRADINATLQTVGSPNFSNGQGVSFRGAAQQNRQTSQPMASAAITPPVQAIASPLDPPPRRNEAMQSSRQDGPSRLDSRQDLMQPRADRNGESGSRENSRPRRREDEHTDRQRSSRNPSKERRPDDEPPQRPPPPGMEDRRDKRGGQREERRPRDSREGPPQGESRRPERLPRHDDFPPRRAAPPEMPGSFAGPPPDWERSNDRRGPRDDSGRGGRGNGRAEDFRGGRREEERRESGRQGRDDGPPALGVRKRRHEDAPFDESKRRRSGR